MLKRLLLRAVVQHKVVMSQNIIIIIIIIIIISLSNIYKMLPPRSTPTILVLLRFIILIKSW